MAKRACEKAGVNKKIIGVSRFSSKEQRKEIEKYGIDTISGDLSNYQGNIQELLSLNVKITDSNAAFFDSANNFAGCITRLHEVLRRQGLLESIWTLDENEALSPGQLEEIDRVYAAYPELNDDRFVSENLDRWLS